MLLFAAGVGSRGTYCPVPDGVMDRGGAPFGVNDLCPGPLTGVIARWGGATPFGVNDICGAPCVGVCDRKAGPGRGEFRPLLSSKIRGKVGAGFDVVELRSSGYGRLPAE